jgi:hypothetical protein
MPVRLVRETILTSDRVNALDCHAEVFYRRLLNVVDDYGLFDGRLSILRASLYPLRLSSVSEEQCDAWLVSCEKVGLIARYKVDGKPFIKLFNTRWKARSTPKYALPPDDLEQPIFDITIGSENGCKQPRAVVPLDVVVVVGVGVDSDTSLRSVSAASAAEKTKEEVWTTGVAMLVSQGTSDRQARGYIGHLVKRHGEEQVLGAFYEAIGRQPADLKSWLTGVLRPKGQGKEAARAATATELYGGNNENGKRDDAPTERDVTAEIQRIA